ncbi:MAG: aminopeptidase P family protein [Clostridia bacterium]|nr:aminopeptidase P family protein [Clostridia bacterium]
MLLQRTEKIYNSLGADAVFTTADDLRFYLTGFESTFGCVITDKNGTTFYTDSRYLEAAVNKLEPQGITVKEMPRGVRPADLIKGYKKTAVPFSRITAKEYLAYSANSELCDSTAAFSAAMAIKEESELAAIKSACSITDKSFMQLLGRIKEGVSENEVAAELEYLMRLNGASGTSFSTIVAFGANASVPHHETGDAKLKYGDSILIDFGCKVGGYCSDCTRTFLFGDDGGHEEFKDAYKKVLEAHMLVKQQITDGITGGQADAIARDCLKKYGLDKYFTHSLGHGIGVNIHEDPRVSPGSEDILQNGMVFSDEPGVYIAGKLGIRIEDTVTLDGGKAVSLTDSDKNIIIL